MGFLLLPEGRRRRLLLCEGRRKTVLSKIICVRWTRKCARELLDIHNQDLPPPRGGSDSFMKDLPSALRHRA